MNCADVELLLCDYVDGTLAPAEHKIVEAHLAACAACAELARDSQAIVAFVERAATVEPPPALVTRILQQIPTQQPVAVKLKSGSSSWIRRLFEPILQPRLVMGMAMTILSFAMLGRFAGIEARQLRVADLNPVKVWEASEDRGHRAWNQAVKYYQSLRIVYEVQSMLRQLTENEDETTQPDNRGAVKPSTPGSPGAENTGNKK